MKSIELFSGAGGLAHGLSNSGFDHAKFVEFNRDACASLRANFGDQLVHEGDVRDFDLSRLSDIDLVAGGPPCQPFSMGGKHQAHDDGRDMFPPAINVVRQLKPRAFVFENVKGLLRESFSAYFDYILERLRYPDLTRRETEDWQEHLKRLKSDGPGAGGLSYRVFYRLLNAADYGVPQIRERVFIVGIRNDLSVNWDFPPATHSRRLLAIDQGVDGSYWDRHKIPFAERQIARLTRAASIEGDLFKATKQAWLTVRDAIGHLPAPETSHNLADHLYRDGARTYPGHTGSYIDSPAKTLKAGVHGVPGGENMIRYHDGSVRYFTVREAKLLQTFPEDFVISGAWSEGMRQVGNAVPVKLAEAIGAALYAAVGDYSRPLKGRVRVA
ncbi:DNA cytosine methyltransferase [Maricaulis sp.]|uniref:DNA cytosine methyltransferase n=1 Tax=Maricaulis sp. TaxID=1486257 RepID=UPI003A928C27